MPEVRCERSVDESLATIWEFVSDMDRWAPLMTGYEAHELHDARTSTWTLRGDLGPMSRSVKLAVTITEWVDAEKVAFTLEGIDEQVKGGGSFTLSETPPPAPPEPPPRSMWQRFMDWILGRRPELPGPTGPGTSHVVFDFEIDALGPMGPMINAMLGPYAEVVAENLLRDVAGHFEKDSEGAAA